MYHKCFKRIEKRNANKTEIFLQVNTFFQNINKLQGADHFYVFLFHGFHTGPLNNNFPTQREND
jgi:hypothetical protein